MQRNTILATLTVLFLAAGTTSAQTFVGIPHGALDPGTCDYLDSARCEDKAVFNTSSFDTWFGRWVYFSGQSARILVNVKYDSDSNGTLDSWRWTESKPAIDVRNVDNGATVALGTVLANGSGIYRNPVDGALYKRVMYFIYQGNGEASAGHLCLAFSNDASGWSWTDPIAAVSSTTEVRGQPCDRTGPVEAEAIAGFHRTGTDLHLFGLNGNLEDLGNAVTSDPNGGPTETYFIRASTDTPDVIEIEGMVTSNGMATPTVPGGDHYYFFPNLDATYDHQLGRVYLYRVTPYGFDEDDPNLPCNGVCPGGLPTFPLRGQIYYMDTGGANWKTTVDVSSWTLLRDIGSDSGWPIEQSGVCANYSTTEPFQEDLGVDLDSLTVHKNPNGRIAKEGGQMRLFLGAWKNKDRKQSCLDAQIAGATNGQGTWRDAELYEMTTPLP